MESSGCVLEAASSQTSRCSPRWRPTERRRHRCTPSLRANARPPVTVTRRRMSCCTTRSRTVMSVGTLRSSSSTKRANRTSVTIRVRTRRTLKKTSLPSWQAAETSKPTSTLHAHDSKLSVSSRAETPQDSLPARRQAAKVSAFPFGSRGYDTRRRAGLNSGNVSKVLGNQIATKSWII